MERVCYMQPADLMNSNLNTECKGAEDHNKFWDNFQCSMYLLLDSGPFPQHSNTAILETRILAKCLSGTHQSLSFRHIWKTFTEVLSWDKWHSENCKYNLHPFILFTKWKSYKDLHFSTLITEASVLYRILNLPVLILVEVVLKAMQFQSLFCRFIYVQLHVFPILYRLVLFKTEKSTCFPVNQSSHTWVTLLQHRIIKENSIFNKCCW